MQHEVSNYKWEATIIEAISSSKGLLLKCRPTAFLYHQCYRDVDSVVGWRLANVYSFRTLEMRIRRHFIISVAACSLMLLAALCAEGQTIRTVALSDMRPVGLPSEVRFVQLESEVIDPKGNVAFNAGRSSLWIEENGSLRLVAYEGGQVPNESEEVRWEPFDFDLSINSAGQLLFDSGGGGLWVDDAGQLREVVRSGEDAPGTIGGKQFFSFYGYPRVLTDSGTVLFWGSISTGSVFPPTGFGTWQETERTLTAVAIYGASVPVPELGEDVVRTDFATSFDNRGNVLLNGTLSGTGISDASDEGLWGGQPGSVTLIAREGEQAAGLPKGVNYGSTLSPILSRDSQRLRQFRATLTGVGVDETNDEAVWSIDDSSITLLIREGDQVAALPDGVGFTSTVFQFSLNTSNEIAFIERIAGPGIDDSNDLAIFAGPPESLRLVAQNGQQAPGTPDGVMFGEGSFGDFAWQTINGLGQVAFRGHLAGPGVDSTNDEAIWAEDVSGELRLIARTGDELEVMPGEFRIIKAVYASINSSGLNDRGQLVFNAFFTDGSNGIFVSNLVAVPEPSTSLLLCISGLVLSAIRRRSRSSYLKASL